MEEQRKNKKPQVKSPIIMSGKSKMALLDCNIQSIPKLKGLNDVSKREQETVETPMDQSITTLMNHPTKTLKGLNLYNCLQSTPNTRNFHKSVIDSRIIMDLSPIMSSTPSLKTNLNTQIETFQHKLHTESNFSMDQLTQNLTNINHEDNKLKTIKTIKEPNNEIKSFDSLILPVNTIKRNGDNVNEKAKRCLFEKEETNNVFNLDTEQDSLNISLDILEQVCQMSEMMDNSQTEEIKVSENTDKKKGKLDFFLYGNNSVKLNDIEEEKELLQLALSMEDNLSTETKSKNNICFKEEFTSLNQLKKKQNHLFENNSKQYENDELKNCISDSKCKYLDNLGINDIGNTQMCEIADITEPIESFDDQWTQQYISNVHEKKTYFEKSFNSNQMVTNTKLKSSKDSTDYKVEKSNELDDTTNKQLGQSIIQNNSSIILKDKSATLNICKGFSTAGGNSINDVSEKALHKVQSMLKDELNELPTPIICKGFSTAGGNSINESDKALHKVQSMLKDELIDSSFVSKDKTIINPNICKGFSTAGGKSIKISDKALHKVQSMLKDEQIDSSTVSNDKTISNPNICKGFSTARGKSIKISDKTLHKVQSMLIDEQIDSFTVSKNKTITNPNRCKGFSTAEGNSINESDKALHKVQSMLKDELIDSSFVSKDKTIINPNICKGFSTAGGKSIKISDKALHKVQSMLKDEQIDSSTVSNDKTISNPNICKGFSTARGKSIKISDKALHKVQSMLIDEQIDSFTVSKNKTITNPNRCKGFSTAEGNSINVSHKALHRVQSMLKDEQTDSSTISKDKTITNPNTCKGFSTAGGKCIKISDKALYKVQSILTDELIVSSTVSIDQTITNPNICKGFSTARGKSIKISDKALHKVQSMLIDEQIDSFTVSKNKTITNPNRCKGFSTAGGNSINVSDNALLKVQSMLKEELIDLSTVSKDKTNTANVCKDFVGDDYIKVPFESLQNIQQTFKDDKKKKRFDNSLKTMSIYTQCGNSNEGSLSKDLDLTVNTNSKSTIFEKLKYEEKCTLEDLSLIDTVEKFEREQYVCNALLRNKRPGSPTYRDNNKVKKIVHNEEWEIDVLKTSFNEYLSKKLNGPKISLPKAVDWGLPKKYDIKQFPNNCRKNKSIKVDIDNALNLSLFWEKGYKLCDKNTTKTYNFQELKNFFLSHNLVDDKLVPKKWIENHFCLIAWKLAETEISFPDHFENKLLTAKNILHQLLYRYYREIEKCQRSALKKILEKDETSTKRIILCVSKVIRTNVADTYSIELTDGWYSVQGLIDFEMNMLLHKGIVKVGTKLMIHNAELIGAGEGIDPLDVHNGVRLKISTNSTRRVRWYAKLGFYKNSTLPIPISLESVLPQGGIIGSVSLVILRKYPMMYLERKLNSKSILRNEKMEVIEAEKYKVSQQKSLEIISNKIKTELIAEMASTTKKSKNYFLSIKKENIDKLSINELSSVLENSTDPSEIQSILSQEQLDALKDYKKHEHDKFYNELQNRVDRVFKEQFKDVRKVTPLIKLRVVDEKYASTGFKTAIITIWNPSEEVSTILDKSREGQCCTFYHLTTNGFINGELHISSNKNTKYDFQGHKNEYAKRDLLTFNSILSDVFSPLFGELDFVGIVISDVNKSNEIYVSDKEMNIISILFRGDIKDYGCDDMMYPGSIISGVNIQFRGFNKISPIPQLYNTEQSSFTTIPKIKHILNTFNEYKMFLKKSENQDFVKCCQKKLCEMINRNMEITTMSNESPKQQCLNMSKHALRRSYGELPVSVVNTSAFSPAQKRIQMLNAYGKTPSLHIVHTKLPEKKLMSPFKTPTRLS